jgi:PAS domain S-box-containing protein
VSEILPAEVAPAIMERVQRALETGQMQTIEFELPEKDGPRGYQAKLVAAGKDEAIAIVDDITERKRMEEEHGFREASLAEAQRIAHLSSWDWDIAGQKLRWSDEAYRQLGFTPGEVVPTYEMFLRFVHPDDRQFVEHSVNAALYEGKPYDIEFRIVRPDGSVATMQSRAEVFSDRTGAPTRMVGTGLDITERKQMETALRVAESNYRSIFENATEGIFRTSEDGQILMCNPALARMHGYESPEEMMENVKDTTLQVWVDPERRAEYKRQLADTGFARGFESQGRRKNGSVIWGLVNARAVRDSRGELLYYEGSVQDISERKRAEKELRTLSTYLLRTQDQERRRIGRELHDSTAQKVAALGMNLSLINGSAASVDSKTHKHLLESQTLVQECLREIRTLSHLLHPPLLDEVGLASALRWYADGFARRSGIRVDLQLPPDFTRMSQEVETTLFRIVQECLTNVHLHSGSPTARICILRNPESVVAAVTDEGCGMRSADRNGATGTVEIGVGIAGMRERVEQFGGRLEIDSTHAGTTVKATLPIPEDGP